MVAQRQWNDKHGAHLAAGLAGYALGITANCILASERGTLKVVRARQIAMYLSHVGFGMSLARVADAFGRDRSTVAHGCHLVEDRRDDPDFDVWMETLEQGLVVLALLNQDTQ